MSFVRRAIPSKRSFVTGSFFRKAQPRQRTWNSVSRRGYASESHGEHKASSDIPWAITSVVVTIPVAGWLWSQGPSGDAHGHDDHHEHKEEHKSEDETHDTEEKGEDKDEDKQEQSDDQEEDAKPDTKDQDKESKTDTKEKPKQEDSSDKSDTDSDSGDDTKDTPDTSDDEKDTKESGSEEVGGKPYSGLQPEKSNNQGAAGYKEKVGQTEGEGPKAASSAMHRDRSHDDKSLSKKSEGLHDTARLNEPVDPHRPAK
ncbi:MAG: hypothetical protein GOMPHAMPRED_005754 [Gomphillus americanus]|uniref:Uncharacterized protein n=1 Tax=Gomphillus americanus TaxID=1940652 RepID=A0A8H3IXC8_9LECA|nr:MAG: hypothetical protein GOMPHAMPRED_005754 [Gomphillus americanus]